MQNYFCQVLITPKKVREKYQSNRESILKYLSILADLKGEHLYYYIIIIIINHLKYFGF